MPNFDEMVCAKCGNPDVSIDLLTNKIMCTKCNHNGFGKKTTEIIKEPSNIPRTKLQDLNMVFGNIRKINTQFKR